MTEMLVGAACYVTFWGLIPGIGPSLQQAAIVLLFAAAAYAAVANKVRAITISGSEIVMYIAGVAYVVLAMLSEQDAVGIAVAFLSCIVFISVICRATSLERLMNAGAATAFLCVLTSVIFDRSEAVAALSPSGGAGLARFMPLNTTPNLVGYIFGAGAILMARRAVIATRRLERAAMIVAAVLACLFVLAASARSSLIALFAAALVAVFFEFGWRRVVSLKWVKWAFTTSTIVGIVFAERIGAYFVRLLDLESQSRGIGSGGSGRTNLWARGIATLFENSSTFFFGGGFRSSNSGLIGFSTESSYITILLDSGALIGTAIILVFWYAPIKALRLTPPAQRSSGPLVLLTSFLTFVIVESVFNRYLLAIGNPTSLMSLLLVFGVAIREAAPIPAVALPVEWHPVRGQAK